MSRSQYEWNDRSEIQMVLHEEEGCQLMYQGLGARRLPFKHRIDQFNIYIILLEIHTFKSYISNIY